MPGQELDLAAWLRALGLERYAPALLDAEVTREILPELTDADLRELGLPLGPRKAVLKAIRGLAGPPAPPGTMVEAARAEGRPDTLRVPPDAERRQLTVMFADLAGSTALSQRLDPEEMGEVLRAYQDAVAGEVARFEGHLAKFMGDGVLAYFGWPNAHEDEAERSVRAGLAAVQAVGRLTTPAGEPLAARVGIGTGLVVVGGLAGEGSAREQSVAGETPNLAARLQAVAQPSAVVIAESTRRLIGSGFEVEDLGPQALKGFADVVQAWRVLGERPVGSRFEARATGLTPLVGREHEVALLLDRWQQARDGEGQVVLLSGEPGIGKSRIARGLDERLTGETLSRLSHQCSPYYVDTALHPTVEQLERAAGFQRNDTPDAKLDKLEALLAEGADRAGETAHLIAALLSIATEGRYPPLNASPQRQMERTLDALVEQVTGLARRRPVLCLFEDVHWADPTTLELLDQLVGRISGERVLLLLTFRTEFSPPWRGRPHATVIALNRLPHRQSAALAEVVAGKRALPDAVLQEIVARADGVPLFVEELTKAVLEVAGDTPEPASARHGLVGPSTPTIPATLQDSLMARLDRLAEAKELAQIGAAIGREFGYELLAAVSLREEGELRDALEQLVASELVFVRGAPPAATYSFKHALVQDAAHASLLKSRRQQLHARIARELEERWPETRQIRPELLAHHFAEAGACDKAAAYGFEAGRAAFGRSAVAEAVVHLQRALGQLSRMPQNDDRRRLELDLQITLGHALIRARGYGVPEVGEAFARARRLAAAADTAQQISLLSGIGAYHYLRSETRASLKVGRDLIRLSRGGDPAAYVEGQRRIGGAFQQLGRLVPAQRHFERGLARFAPTQDPVREIGLHGRTLLDAPCAPVLQPAAARLSRPRPEAARRSDRADAASGASLDAGVDPALVGYLGLPPARWPRASEMGGRVRGADSRAHARALHTMGADLARLAGRRGRGRRRERRAGPGGAHDYPSHRRAVLVPLFHGPPGRHAQSSGQFGPGSRGARRRAGGGGTDRRAGLRGRAAPAEGSSLAGADALFDGRSRDLPPAGFGRRPAAGGAPMGVARSHRPRPSLAGQWPIAGSTRPAGAGVRLVHRGPRHAGPRRGRKAARNV